MRTIFKVVVLVAVCGGAAVTLAVPKHNREFAYVLDKTPDLVRGEALYQTCAACHGAKGQGASDGSVPAIAGQHFPVVAKQIVDFRHSGRLDVRMQHFVDESHLDLSQQIADVAAYISSMKPVASASAREFNTAAAKFYSEACARCHGSRGEGQADWLVPRLAGQHFEYLVRQVEETRKGIRPNMSREHVESLAQLDEPTIASLAQYLAGLAP